MAEWQVRHTNNEPPGSPYYNGEYYPEIVIDDDLEDWIEEKIKSMKTIKSKK